MLDCKACISTCIRTIFADVLHPIHQSRLQRRSLLVLKEFHLLPTAGRAYHTARPTQRNLSRQDGLQSRRHSTTRHQTTQAISADDHFYTAPPPPQLNIQRFDPREVKPFDRSGQRNNALDFKKKKHLDRELLYLQDPLKLAENTIELLRNDDNEKALDLVRLASKKMPCTVSWNHLVDYEMSTGRVKDAVKIYNEVIRSFGVI